MDKFEVKLDQAARAAWMSYVGGMTQDEIASWVFHGPACSAC